MTPVKPKYSKLQGRTFDGQAGTRVAPFSAMLTLVGTCLVLLMSTASCGPPQYGAVDSVDSQSAAGDFKIPAKIDLLLAEDNTGSMYGMFSEVKKRLPGFLTSLEGSGWDYRFAVTPLTTRRAIDQILASRYDGNWGNEWMQPFPGANYDSLWAAGAFVDPNYFRFPVGYGSNEFSRFLTTKDVSTAGGADEQGFNTVLDVLEDDNSGFIRQDSMLVIFALSNGNDTSGVNFCERVDGAVVPCEYTGHPNCSSAYGYDYKTGKCKLKTGASSLDVRRQALLNLKGGDAGMIRFYSAVSTTERNDCLKAHAKAGLRYSDMATALGGWTRDLCTESLSEILKDLRGSLQEQRLKMRMIYLVIGKKPNLSTVKIYKYPNGKKADAILVPQDPVNGWSYVGYQQNLPVIDYPADLNARTGYMFRLNGAARLVGADSADVQYLPEGINPDLRNN